MTLYMKVTQNIQAESREYMAPSVRVRELGPCFPVCLQASNGAVTEDYEEEDIWNN
jgi:hypothetical protein